MRLLEFYRETRLAIAAEVITASSAQERGVTLIKEGERDQGDQLNILLVSFQDMMADSGPGYQGVKTTSRKSKMRLRKAKTEPPRSQHRKFPK